MIYLDNFYKDYEELFNSRLTKLVNTLDTTNFPKTPPFASLIYLKKLLTEQEGHLFRIRVEVLKTLGNNRNMDYKFKDNAKTLKLDNRLID